MMALDDPEVAQFFHAVVVGSGLFQVFHEGSDVLAGFQSAHEPVCPPVCLGIDEVRVLNVDHDWAELVENDLPEVVV